MKKTLSTSKEVQILKSLQVLTNTKISHYFKSFLSFLTKFCILLPLVWEKINQIWKVNNQGVYVYIYI